MKDDNTSRPSYERIVNPETGEVTYLMLVQGSLPVELCEQGFLGLQEDGWLMNAHLNSGKYPRMRRRGDRRPYLISHLLHKKFIGPVDDNEMVVPVDGNFFNLKLTNLVRKSMMENPVYRAKHEARLAELAAELKLLKEQKKELQKAAKHSAKHADPHLVAQGRI